MVAMVFCKSGRNLKICPLFQDFNIFSMSTHVLYLIMIFEKNRALMWMGHFGGPPTFLRKCSKLRN